MAGLPLGINCGFPNPQPKGKPMQTMKLRDIPAKDAAGNLYTIEVMRDIRFITPVSGHPEPHHRDWYRYQGLEGVAKSNLYQFGTLALQLLPGDL